MLKRSRSILTVLILTFAPARVLHAQFELPYDPDFAPAETITRPALKPAAPAAGAPADEPQIFKTPDPSRFRLLQRSAGGPILSRDELSRRTTDHPILEGRFKAIRYTPRRWREMLQNKELGLSPVLPPPQYYIPQAVAITTAAPAPPPPEMELPAYGTSLSITGRKIIGFSFSQKRFMNEQKTKSRPATSGLFDINQQLQLRMQGKVGPKIAVNVDYDDNKIDKQDISVTYQGDANDVIQNVSFGDIDLSLPSTEFVSYNKQLFGIRADIKYKGFNTRLIGSRTKGVTKVKRFYGNSKFETKDISDISYIRRRYYDITFGDPGARLPIRSGSERIFLARQVPDQVNLDDVTLTVDDLAVSASSFTGTFTELSPGTDYTIDYTKGIINFRRFLESQYVLAVDFIDATGNSITVQSTQAYAGGTGLFKIIKSPSDLPILTTDVSISSEVGFKRELKTFYNIGQVQIIRDDGRGNFIFKVIDPTTREEVGSELNPVQEYPDTIFVDFENGVFQLEKPFSVSNASPTVEDPDIYAPTPISKRLIRVEYSYRFKTFFLEPSLVPQSEVVLLDGMRLVRNVDYFIDYTAGFITFFNENRIRPGSEINIGYEVAPFLGISNESLMGTRVSYEINKHVKLGGTLLYQSGTKSPVVPNIGDLARSLLTYETDMQLKDIRISKWLTANISGEFAQSAQSPNLNDFALIDNMEGAKQETTASTLSYPWKVASNPGGVPSDPTRISVFSEDVSVLQINPKSDAGEEETQKVLGLSYDFSDDDTKEVSIVFPFSIAGSDFSQKTLLEVVMLGDNSGNEINFHLGGIDEDSDGDGVLDTEDLNNDKIVQADEDIGYTYNPAGKPSTKYGENNGLLDSEDLNQNDRLDAQDQTGDSFGYAGSAGNTSLWNATDSTAHTFIDFGADNKWRTFQIPLNITTATASRWQAVKQVRISIRKRAGGDDGPSAIKFARIAVVGNSWQRGAAGDPSSGAPPQGAESLVVTPVNSIDNPDYVPIFNAGGAASEVFKDLYGDLGNLQQKAGSRNLSEQALQLEFKDLANGSVVHTQRNFGRAIDISQHRYFNFLVYGNAGADINVTGDKVFFLRAGNEKNFFEVAVPLNFTGWKKIKLKQADLNGDSIADIWESDNPGYVVTSSGAPSLQQVAHIMAGVRAVGASAPTSGRVYLNEIYLSDPVRRVGTAKKLEAGFTIPGWATFGGKHRSVDRNFQTPTSVVSNQDNQSDTGYITFSRIRSFPMNFNLSRTIKKTPSTVQTGTLSNTINLLQQGKVTTWNGTASGNFSYGRLPRVTLNYSRNRIEYDTLTRLDDRKTYNGSLSYIVPLKTRFFPKTLDADYSYSQYQVSYDSLFSRKIAGNFNTDEKTQRIGGRMTFTPWKGSGFNPNYSLTVVKEERSDFTGPEEIKEAYSKSLTQRAGFTSNFRFLRWLNPQLNYSVTTIENNILNVSTFTIQSSTFVFKAGEIKTVNRNATGSISLPIAVGDIFRKWKVLRTMHIASGYQIQDGDVWNNVEHGLKTHFDMWVRSSINPSNPVAQRANQTLRDTYNSSQRWSPLEAFKIPGRLEPFRSLSLSNNYVHTVTRRDVTGTTSKSYSTTFPDMVASISRLEKMLFMERWMKNTQMNFKYSRNENENVGQSFDESQSFGTDLRSVVMKRFDTLVSYNFTTSQKKDLRIGEIVERTSHEDSTVQVTFDIRKFRFTPKIFYSNDVRRLGTGLKTSDLTVITPSLLMRADLALPRGLKLPWSAKTLLFTNRIIWTTTMALANRLSPITIADNSNLFTLSTSGDYEIAKNLRMTMSGGASRLWHRYLKEEEFVSYQFGSTLTFQF